MFFPNVFKVSLLISSIIFSSLLLAGQENDIAIKNKRLKRLIRIMNERDFKKNKFRGNCPTLGMRRKKRDRAYKILDVINNKSRKNDDLYI